MPAGDRATSLTGDQGSRTGGAGTSSPIGADQPAPLVTAEIPVDGFELRLRPGALAARFWRDTIVYDLACRGYTQRHLNVAPAAARHVHRSGSSRGHRYLVKAWHHDRRVVALSGNGDEQHLAERARELLGL